MNDVTELKEDFTKLDTSFNQHVNNHPSGGSGAVNPQDIEKAVNDYMVKNPVKVTETDPTVPAWAKEPTKPTYTASEVGALPSSTKIPTKLPNPNTLTFTGAVTGTYDGSQPLTIDIPQGGSGSNGGASADKPFRKVIDRALGAEVSYMDFSVDDSGQPLSFEEAYVRVTASCVGDANKNYSIGVLPHGPSYNSRSIYLIPIYTKREFYSAVVHFKKVSECVLGELVANFKCGVFQKGTPISFNFNATSINNHGKVYFFNKTLHYGTKEILNSEGKMNHIAVGGDMANSVTFESDSIVEVWVR